MKIELSSCCYQTCVGKPDDKPKEIDKNVKSYIVNGENEINDILYCILNSELELQNSYWHGRLGGENYEISFTFIDNLVWEFNNVTCMMK